MSGSSAGSGRHLLLAIDTSGSRALLALGEMDGAPVGETRWTAGFRHGEELLTRLQALLGDAGVALRDVSAIAVGTGPGAFTGLRVGLATAKALASGLAVPLVGIASSSALVAAARDVCGLALGEPVALVLPAGPSDRVVIYDGGSDGQDSDASEQPARLVHGGEALGVSGLLVAVDLDGRVPDDAAERGRRADDLLGRWLLRLGAARLAATGGDDLGRLVPEYVTLPRGVAAVAGEVRWSRGTR